MSLHAQLQQLNDAAASLDARPKSTPYSDDDLVLTLQLDYNSECTDTPTDPRFAAHAIQDFKVDLPTSALIFLANGGGPAAVRDTPTALAEITDTVRTLLQAAANALPPEDKFRALEALEALATATRGAHHAPETTANVAALVPGATRAIRYRGIPAAHVATIRAMLDTQPGRISCPHVIAGAASDTLGTDGAPRAGKLTNNVRPHLRTALVRGIWVNAHRPSDNLGAHAAYAAFLVDPRSNTGINIANNASAFPLHQKDVAQANSHAHPPITTSMACRPVIAMLNRIFAAAATPVTLTDTLLFLPPNKHSRYLLTATPLSLLGIGSAPDAGYVIIAEYTTSDPDGVIPNFVAIMQGADRRALTLREAPFIRVSAPSRTSYDIAVREVSLAPPSAQQPGTLPRRTANKRARPDEPGAGAHVAKTPRTGTAVTARCYLPGCWDGSGAPPRLDDDHLNGDTHHHNVTTACAQHLLATAHMHMACGLCCVATPSLEAFEEHATSKLHASTIANAAHHQCRLCAAPLSFSCASWASLVTHTMQNHADLVATVGHALANESGTPHTLATTIAQLPRASLRLPAHLEPSPLPPPHSGAAASSAHLPSDPPTRMHEPSDDNTNDVTPPTVRRSVRRANSDTC